jgi:hypothetical protein
MSVEQIVSGEAPNPLCLDLKPLVVITLFKEREADRITLPPLMMKPSA